MNKRTICLLLLSVLLLSCFAGCGKSDAASADWKRSTEITVDGETVSCPFYYYDVLPDKTVRIDRIWNINDDLHIPEAIDGMPVSTLGRYMLKGIILREPDVSIPDCVTVLEGNPFDSFPYTSLKFQLSDSHPTLEFVDGVLLSKPDRRLICASASVSEFGGEYRIPEGTKIIEDHAFAFSSFGYGTVVIPDSVETLKSNPFALCNLNRNRGGFILSLSADHPTLEIRDGFLYSKPDHRLVCVADYKALFDRNTLAIPEGTEILDDFCLCSGGRNDLSSVSIPASVKSVGINPFYGADSLTEIVLDPKNAELELVDHLLYSKSDRRMIAPENPSLDRFTVRDGTELLGAYAFSYSHNNEAWEVSLPDSLREIGDRAFSGSQKLRCSIPSGLRYIGASAFSFWTPEHATELKLQGSVEIGCYAFSDTAVRSGIISGLTITGADRVMIGRGAFYACGSLENVHIEAKEAVIADGAFADTGLTDVSFSEGLAAIGSNVFLNYITPSLRRIDLPRSLIYIGDLNTSSRHEIVRDGKFDVEVAKEVITCDAEVCVQPGSYAEQFCRENGIEYRNP